MSRPKGSKNKKNQNTEQALAIENIDEQIASVETTITTLTEELKAKKVELKNLNELKAEAERIAAEKKAEEDRQAILTAVETSGKSIDEILAFLQQ